MDPVILVLNSGSSSIKFTLYSGDTVQLKGQISGLGAQPHISLASRVSDTRVDRQLSADEGKSHGASLAALLPVLEQELGGRSVDAVGHRVVHGGVTHTEPVCLTAEILEDLKALEPLAPLHQPHNLAGITAAREAFPEAMQVACFDTAFHRSHPWVNDTFALPRPLYDEGVRRYGFHGLSYEYICSYLKQAHPEIYKGRLVVAHLGNGASMCAIREGQSIGSTMGFTALDGLPMGTRCGSIDPGAVLWLAAQGMSADEIQSMLYGQSGLKGISGISSDMRALLASDALRARLAVDFYAYRAAQEIGKLAVTLGGLDALVFTAGIGANSPQVRARICAQLTGLFGIVIDEAANNANRQLVSHANSRVPVWALQTDEEGMIALSTARILRDNGGL